MRRFPLLPTAGRDLLPALRTRTTLVPLDAAAIVSVTGDPEDDVVLATARFGHVDYLVTGDRALLGLRSYEGVRMVTPRDFLIAIDSTEEAT